MSGQPVEDACYEAWRRGIGAKETMKLVNRRGARWTTGDIITKFQRYANGR